jgi:arylsulfatase A-like enzyme
VAALVCLGIGLVGALAYPQRDTGGTYALEGDRNVVLITVDGLGRGDVGAYGGPTTRAIDGLAAANIVMDNAVTPAVLGAPANASVQTGLHPLRNRVLLDGDPLGMGFRTLAEALSLEGYATGAFVSESEVGATAGFSQGFRVFDDAFDPFLPGVVRINLVRWAMWAKARLMDEGAQHRSAAHSLERYQIWYAQHRDVPHFGWLHLSDPVHDGARGVAAADQAIATVLADIEDAGRAEDTLVVVLGTHGRPTGQAFLTEVEVRVPLILRAPGATVAVQRVPQQVRLMDVAATVMGFLKLDTLGETEGVSLLGYVSGERRAAMSCALVGRDDAGNPLLGLRNNGIKWVRTVEDGDHLFDLANDPLQQHDLAEERADTVRRARTLMTADIIAFRQMVALR